jgi:hypothetical protein
MKNSEPTIITVTLPFKALCIDDKNRPKEIPENIWLKEGKPYTITDVKKLRDGTLGFVVLEVPLGEHTFPYFYLSSSRFGIPINEKDLEEYVKQSEPETVCQEEPVLL